MVVELLLSMALLIGGSLSRADMERAVSLAWWPHTDAERARFHDRYLFLTIAAGPLADGTKVLQIEVVTEFRRLELLAEAHARLGDSFGRGGSDELVDALRPWHGRLAIDVHLQLPSCGDDCTPAIPPIDVVIDGAGSVHANPAARVPLYAHTGLSPAVLGSMAEASFDAAAIGQRMRSVRVIVAGREIARMTIDFGALE